MSIYRIVDIDTGAVVAKNVSWDKASYLAQDYAAKYAKYGTLPNIFEECHACLGEGIDRAHKWDDGSYAHCPECDGYGYYETS